MGKLSRISHDFSMIEPPGNQVLEWQLECHPIAVIKRWSSLANTQLIEGRIESLGCALERFIKRKWVPNLKPTVRRGYAKADTAYSHFIECLFDVLSEMEDELKINGISVSKWFWFDELLQQFRGNGLLNMTVMLYADENDENIQSTKQARDCVRKTLRNMRAGELPSQEYGCSLFWLMTLSYAIRKSESNKYFKRNRFTPLMRHWRQTLEEMMSCFYAVKIIDQQLHYVAGSGRHSQPILASPGEIRLHSKISER